MIVSDSKGAAAIIVAIVLVVLISFAALAVDIGYLMVTRNELQNIADAASLAGARTLGRLYECNGQLNPCTEAMPYADQQTYAADVAAIQAAVTDVAASNHAGGKGAIVINPADIVIGNWNPPTNPPTDRLAATTIAPDAVRVTARRDASANNPITTFLAGVMGIDTVDVSATATAALRGLSEAGPGSLPIPIAINKAWVSNPENCGTRLRFRPASLEACAVWHVYDEDSGYSPGGTSVPASKMRKLLQDLAAGTFESPETFAGETEYILDNGVMAAVFEDMLNLFDTMRVLNDGILDKDEDPATWTCALAVFDDEGMNSCSPSGANTIIGFATITVTDVLLAPENEVWGYVVCDLIQEGPGDNSDFGTKGSIPRLVQ